MNAPGRTFEESEWILEIPYDSATYLAEASLPSEPAPDTDRPAALFLAGGPLSGKTTVLAQLQQQGHDLIPSEAVIVDPYAIRAQLPEYMEGVAGRVREVAASVYEEVIHIAGALVSRAVAERRNLILDGIGDGDEGAFVEQLRRMNAAGYDVSVLVVHVPNEVAEARNLERARSEGRHVDPELLRAMYVAVSRSHLEWRSLEWSG